MSFNRIKYDDKAYDLRLERSTGPGDYRLYLGNNESCEQCLSYDGPRNAKSDVSISSNETTNQWPSMTEVESLLTNRVNKLIDYNMYGKNDLYKNIYVNDKTSCKESLITEESRFTNPIEAYRCMDVTLYHYTPFLYVNAQCEYQEDRIGLNSRLKIKDTFKVKNPNPIDQTSIFPNNNNNNNNLDNNNNNDNDNDICANY